jgi:hypothetical protein
LIHDGRARQHKSVHAENKIKNAENPWRVKRDMWGAHPCSTFYPSSPLFLSTRPGHHGSLHELAAMLKPTPPSLVRCFFPHQPWLYSGATAPNTFLTQPRLFPIVVPSRLFFSGRRPASEQTRRRPIFTAVPIADRLPSWFPLSIPIIGSRLSTSRSPAAGLLFGRRPPSGRWSCSGQTRVPEGRGPSCSLAKLRRSPDRLHGVALATRGDRRERYREWEDDLGRETDNLWERDKK